MSRLSPTAISPVESVPRTTSTIIPQEADIDRLIVETLARLEQGLIDMKEGLSEMKMSVKQCFDQVNTVLAEMKGVYDTTTLQQLFQQSPKVQALFPQDQMFGAEGSQSIRLDSILDGLMLQYIRQTPSQQSQPLAGK